MWVLSRNCKNCWIVREKECRNQVVRGFELRGAATTTRLEGLVVWGVVSCLGVGVVVGMND